MDPIANMKTRLIKPVIVQFFLYSTINQLLSILFSLNVDDVAAFWVPRVGFKCGLVLRFVPKSSGTCTGKK